MRTPEVFARAVLDSLTRVARDARRDNEALRVEIDRLRGELDRAQEIARDAISAADTAHAEVTLVKALFSTLVREQSELVRHFTSPAKPLTDGGGNG